MRSYNLSTSPSGVRAATTGPDGGIAEVMHLVHHPQLQGLTFDSPPCDWAWGKAISLYERNPDTGARAGDPIADCFATVCWEGHSLLVMADGVGWGEPAKKAARCAVLGVVSHVHENLFGTCAAGGGPT